MIRTDEDIIRLAQEVLQKEAEAVMALKERIGANFVKAVDLLYHCEGRVVVCGMGKSGQISRKIAATLASTGTPALFLHPSEALHGDLGMIRKEDVVLVLSNRGETEDILKLLPTIENMGIPVIAILGRSKSTIASKADIVLDAGVEREAGRLDLAPTSSTTAALAMGDALAIVLMEKRDLTPEDFAAYHPDGSLGKQLLTTVHALMHSGNELPFVKADTPMVDAIIMMTEKGLGITGVVDNDGKLVGAITDGDLRRALKLGQPVLDLQAHDVMTHNPKTILKTHLAAQALAEMEDFSITSLFVMENGNGRIPAGLIHIHDILKLGIKR